MLNGDFFKIWLKESTVPFKEKYVSELQYHLKGCQYDLIDGGLQLVVCLLRPFFNSY